MGQWRDQKIVPVRAQSKNARLGITCLTDHIEDLPIIHRYSKKQRKRPIKSIKKVASKE